MNISLLEPIGVPEEMIESLAEGLKNKGTCLLIMTLRQPM